MFLFFTVSFACFVGFYNLVPIFEESIVTDPSPWVFGFSMVSICGVVISDCFKVYDKLESIGFSAFCFIDYDFCLYLLKKIQVVL